MKNNQCPNCHQFKLEKRSMLPFALGLYLTVIGTLLLILLVGFLLVPPGIILIVVSFFLKGYKCKNCHWQTGYPLTN